MNKEKDLALAIGSVLMGYFLQYCIDVMLAETFSVSLIHFISGPVGTFLIYWSQHRRVAVIKDHLKNEDFYDIPSKQHRVSQVAKPPGSKLMALIRLCYSAKSVDKIFDPIYADFCEEYFAVLAAGKKWHTRWIRVRYYKDFVKAIGLFGVVRLARTVFEYWEKIA